MKKNSYTCQNPDCEHVTITQEVNKGTTPQMILCPVCNQSAYSAWFRIDQSLPATHEWYMPTGKVIRQLVDAELKALKKSLRRIPRAYKSRSKYMRHSFMDHWKKGGLFLRPIHNLVNIDADFDKVPENYSEQLENILQ